MTEIPADIMKIAEEVNRLCYEQQYQQVCRPLVIARALLDERNRCTEKALYWAKLMQEAMERKEE